MLDDFALLQEHWDSAISEDENSHSREKMISLLALTSANNCLLSIKKEKGYDYFRNLDHLPKMDDVQEIPYTEKPEKIKETIDLLIEYLDDWKGCEIVRFLMGRSGDERLLECESIDFWLLQCYNHYPLLGKAVRKNPDKRQCLDLNSSTLKILLHNNLCFDVNVKYENPYLDFTYEEWEALLIGAIKYQKYDNTVCILDIGVPTPYLYFLITRDLPDFSSILFTPTQRSVENAFSRGNLEYLEYILQSRYCFLPKMICVSEKLEKNIKKWKSEYPEKFEGVQIKYGDEEENSNVED